MKRYSLSGTFRGVMAMTAIVLCGCGEKSAQTEASQPKAETPAPVAGARSAGPRDVLIPGDSPKLSQIKVQPAASAEVAADEVASPGKVEVNPNRLSHVVLPVSGRVTKVFVQIGDAVRQGQTLLSVESSDVDEAISSYLQTQAGVTQSRSGLNKAEADLERTKDLFDHNAVAKKEVLNAEAVRTQSKAALDQSLATAQQAQRRLEILGIKPGEFGQTLQVRAPVSGKVLEMNVVTGEYRNDTSTPVLTIADLSTVWVTSDVSESSIRLIQKGQKVRIELDAYPGDTFNGRVTQIADTVDPATRTVKVRAELENSKGKLRPEMFARIRLTDKFESRPVVPVSAVVQGESGSWVMREVSTGRFRQTPVKTGNRVGDSIAILAGITPGDRIVTDGVLLIRD